MADGIQIRVHPKLVKILSDIQEEISKEIREKYDLEEVKLHGTVASEIMASKFNGKKEVHFFIQKTKLKEGIIKVL